MLSLGTTLYTTSMLAVVLGLIVGLGWLLRTYGHRLGLQGTAAAKPSLKILQRLPLGPQHSLLEVADATSRYLIAIGPNHTTLLEKSKRPTTKQPRIKT